MPFAPSTASCFEREATRSTTGRPAAIAVNSARAALDLLRRAEVIQPDGSIRRLTGAPVDFDEQALLKANAYARVNQVMEYAGSRGCRHARIADYFGEQGVARSCMACDNCLDSNRSDLCAR